MLSQNLLLGGRFEFPFFIIETLLTAQNTAQHEIEAYLTALPYRSDA